MHLFYILLIRPPAPSVPDGAGAFVPFTNSGVMPDGTLRDYSPELDGVMLPSGEVVFPYAPPPAPYPPGRVTVGAPEPMYASPPMVRPPPAPQAPRHVHKPAGKPSTGGGCYDGSGRFREPPSPDCQTPAPIPQSGPAAASDRERLL